jgi:GTP-binding protein
MDVRLLTTPVVAIVGRTNVGKSTLFNRLLEQKKALTSPIAGTTRDVNYGHFHWCGQTMTAIDTAGLDLTSDAATEDSLKRQAQMAMSKAGVIIFMVDIVAGVTPEDRALARYLQKSKKTVILAANKADNPRARRQGEDPEWQKLGFGRPMPISAANGSGVGDLLDQLIEEVRAKGLDTRPLPEIDARIAIIGRPNVGKSTLLNGLAGEERVIVSEVPHTTKEPQDTLLTIMDPKRGEKNILLVDTVGIRKRSHIGPGLERVGVGMTLGELERADIAFLIIDAGEGVGLQEKKLASLIEENRPGVLVVVNKWDLAEKKQLGRAEDYMKYIAGQLPFYGWAPVTFISAKTGSHIGRLIGYALEIAAERQRELSADELTAFAEKLKKMHHSAFRKGESRPKVYGLTQVGTKPPAFMLVVQDKETLHPNFLRFVEKKLRQEFGFEGTPIRVMAREIS